MDFSESCRYLFGLGHETAVMKLGLENTRRMLALLDEPQLAFTKIQIAGTNGKGSIGAMLQCVCTESGIKAGIYSSPHLVSVTERVRVCEREIAPVEFARCASVVRFAAERVRSETGALPTFFEQLTALALVHFRETKIELAILETGLGGRLDATTAADAEVAALTPISLDHQNYLGDTLAAIAAEKAAIIRLGGIAITAPQDDVVMRVVERQAQKCNVDLRVAVGEAIEHEALDTGRLRVTLRTKRAVYEDVRLALRGRHQITNALLAVHLAETLAESDSRITRETIKRGLEHAAHPGRLELHAAAPQLLLLDGAHNPAGANALAEFLREFVPQPLTLIFGAMQDKDLAKALASLSTLAARIIFTTVNNPRTATLEQLFAALPQQTRARLAEDDKIIFAENSTDALALARRITTADNFICVTGSLYLVGEIKALLATHDPLATQGHGSVS